MRARRRETTRGAATAAGEGTRSSRYRNLQNPFVPTRVFSDDQVESLHQMALGMLETPGYACAVATRARGVRGRRRAG